MVFDKSGRWHIVMSIKGNLSEPISIKVAIIVDKELLQQALAEDGVLNILLVLEDEAGNNGTKQCC